jgi:transposase
VSEEQQKQIEQWLAALGTPQQVALRGRIVLAAGLGKTEAAIAAEMNVNRKTVRLWRERFAAQGLPGLWEIAPGRGRKATFSPKRVKALIDATLQSKPKGMTHWSCRLMAAHQGLSKSTVSNLWRSHNIKPHCAKTFKLSRDPKFLQKLTDVVGLYLNPPDKAIVHIKASHVPFFSAMSSSRYRIEPQRHCFPNHRHPGGGHTKRKLSTAKATPDSPGPSLAGEGKASGGLR